MREWTCQSRIEFSTIRWNGTIRVRRQCHVDDDDVSSAEGSEVYAILADRDDEDTPYHSIRRLSPPYTSHCPCLLRSRNMSHTRLQKLKVPRSPPRQSRREPTRVLLHPRTTLPLRPVPAPPPHLSTTSPPARWGQGSRASGVWSEEEMVEAHLQCAGRLILVQIS